LLKKSMDLTLAEYFGWLTYRRLLSKRSSQGVIHPS